MPTSVGNFVVLTLPQSGTLADNAPNTNEYTFVASAANIALAMLESPQGRHWLVELAATIDASRPQSAGGPQWSGNRAALEPLITLYLQKLRSRFPPIVINYTLTNLDVLGATPRKPWDGNFQQFDPRAATMIYLNGSRVSDMLDAEATGKQQRFRDFQFLFATTLVHEAGGHLLVTYFSHGRLDTPSGVTVPGYGDFEAGRWLETGFFGGTTEFYRDQAQDNQQTGVPHQIDGEGRAWKISPETINSMCQYQFVLPFARVGNAVNPTTMHSMGRNSTDLPHTERDRQMYAQQLHVLRTTDTSKLRGYTVMVRELMAIPMDSHRKLAEFITLDHRGSPVTQEVAVDLGDPNEAFSLLPKEIGFAFRAGILSNNRSISDSLLAEASDQCPLTFYHDSQYFAHESSPYPRLVIPQALPRQSDADTSPATLHTFGATHSITLDGTFDAEFTNHLRDSLRELKGSLDQLKDM
ncbi:hypothetical protein FQN50_000470 [Emmonsiellopsis sp. PD_5]|nr:hypothetical protein FQN50_000470 [Emmonsiellopsis sp. PD_5]